MLSWDEYNEDQATSPQVALASPLEANPNGPQPKSQQALTPQEIDKKKAELARQREELGENLTDLLTDVHFGALKVWTESKDKGPGFLVFEFVGALLTGVLVSIGAPYWHDLLRSLTKLRQPKAG